MKHFSLIVLSLCAVSSVALAEDELKAAAQARKGAPAQHRNMSPAVQAQRQKAMNSATVRQMTNTHRVQGSRSSRYTSAGIPSRVYQSNGDLRARNWQNSSNWNRRNTGVVNSGVAAETDAAIANANTARNVNRQWNGNVDRARRGNWARHSNWDRGRHDRGWWHSHYNRFAVFGGGYYFWDNGYWYPAYGYDPYFTSYAYDAPIYSYNDQDPGQVIANVQSALQQQGYYQGLIDGTYGPQTRRALLNFQRNNGLPESGQIDEDTLGALGMR